MQAINRGGHAHLAPGIATLKIDGIGTNLAGAQVDAIARLPGIKLGFGDAGKFIGRRREVAESPLADLFEDFGIAGTGPGFDDVLVKMKQIVGVGGSNEDSSAVDLRKFRDDLFTHVRSI